MLYADRLDSSKDLTIWKHDARRIVQGVVVAGLRDPSLGLLEKGFAHFYTD